MALCFQPSLRPSWFSLACVLQAVCEGVAVFAGDAAPREQLVAVRRLWSAPAPSLQAWGDVGFVTCCALGQ